MKFAAVLFSVLMFCTIQAKSVLLIVDSTYQTSLQSEITQWQKDATNDGWSVETLYIPPRTAYPKNSNEVRTLAASIIWPRVNATTNLHVFLVGATPVPRSGLYINPDGHPDTYGAYACLGYYVTPSTNWTDIGNNTGTFQMDGHKNIPGDGRFDNEMWPAGSTVKGEVGLIDMSPANIRYWSNSTNETTQQLVLRKYKEYFARLHEYKTAGWAIKTKVGHGNGYQSIRWPNFTNWAYANFGTNYLYFTSTETTNKTQPYTIYSRAPFGILYDFKLVSYEGWLWKSIGTKVGGRWAVLDLYFGSYNVDLGSERLINSLLAGSLATGSYTWGEWSLDGFVNGKKTLGEIWKQTVAPSNSGYIYRSLYGDPTIVYKNADSMPPIRPSGLAVKSFIE